MATGRKILLGVSGSIAAYKSAYLTRLLVKQGAEVRVVMTPDACQFVAPLTFSTLSKNETYWQFTSDSGTSWNNHVELALWADLVLIAPATANTLAKMANGICDNLLLAVYQSAKCPVAIAPAMDLDMYQHPANRHNMKKLADFGLHIIPAEHGELASGLEGEGRMAEPEHILAWIADFFRPKGPWAGKRVAITAGPTREAIDPVRYITNHSSGKMGIALAEEAARRGAKVVLILGPTELKPANPAIEVVAVDSAGQMLKASEAVFTETDVFIGAAAVADYTPSKPSGQKVKKNDEDLNIPLKRTADILKTLGQKKRKGQLLVGFALETHEGEIHAREKLKAKNLDLIVLNTLDDEGAGFGYDTNKVTLIGRNNKSLHMELKPKAAVAADILDHLTPLLDA